ncbi:DUF6493 family protein [Micromonospora cathayae]|uniref:DUF6493 family protein n=1 Tax=Micromonospora cathayae TaxID=3028804 RepID=A0ABY7ZKH9_9ACTN|nr:DUF6493 family protein [Micromonospora sp. HUAS 3]WDZ83466.1 DUF6493 family protein [Micromonospora sp. HUAS 3]
MTGLDFLAAGNVRAATYRVSGLTEEHRRELARELVEYVRQQPPGSWWSQRRATALAVLAVGCLPSAAQVARMLGRRSVSLRLAAAHPVIEVARQRGVPWLADLAYRLADRLAPTDPEDGWFFVADLVTAEQAPPPTGDTFVSGWVAAVLWPPEQQRALPLRNRLAADPFLDALVPRLFEVDGLGARLATEDFRTRETMGIPRALADLARTGRLDRAALLDGCLSRLLRDDRPAALRPFVALHDLLAPTVGEVAARGHGYLRLLADAPVAVATMAQKTVRRWDGVEVEAFLDVSAAVLLRPDKALVRAQVGELDRLARRRPDRAAEIVEVLAGALTHPAAEVRDRAGAVAARHGYRPAPPVVVTPAGDDLPPPAGPAPAEPPLSDPDEVAEQVGVLLAGTLTAVPLERILDGLVRLAGAERSRLVRALVPVLDRHRGRLSEHQWDPCCLCGVLDGVLRAATDPGHAEPRRGRWHALMAAVGRLPEARRQLTEPRVPAPHRLLRARLAEIAGRVGEPGRPGLLAAPTSTTGEVDPGTLYERIAHLGATEPWRWDLAQALLRLPAGVDEPLAGKAAALGTPAGDQLAQWLRHGGLPRPVAEVVTVHRRERRRPYDWEYDRLPEQRTLVRMDPPDGYADRYGLLTLPPVPVGTGYGRWATLWPAVLPGYPGLVAAYLLPEVASGADQDVRDAAATLPLLAECRGDGGPALDLALAYGLGCRHETDRVAALDALLGLAAAGRLDATAVGTHLGALAAAGGLTLTRVSGPLRDAVTAGAPLTVWRLLAAALPALLAAPTAPRGTPDLLTLAAETAAATGGRAAVPGLAEVAARGGSGRLVTEARRLVRVLGG